MNLAEIVPNTEPLSLNSVSLECLVGTVLAFDPLGCASRLSARIPASQPSAFARQNTGELRRDVPPKRREPRRRTLVLRSQAWAI